MARKARWTGSMASPSRARAVFCRSASPSGRLMKSTLAAVAVEEDMGVGADMVVVEAEVCVCACVCARVYACVEG